MYKKLNHLLRIIDSGIIAVVRAESPDQALKIARACRAGGIQAIEITMTVPGALAVIEELGRAYPNGEILFGAGTVLDPETARDCITAGADFIVCPNLNPDTIRLTNRYGKIIMPGTYSITEITQALELGSDIIKFFPGSLGGAAAIRAIKGPLPHVPLCPTGGVSLNNVGDWIEAGAVAIGVGGQLTKGAKTGDYDGITARAKEFISRIKEARNR